jgi:hypothetical protein
VHETKNIVGTYLGSGMDGKIQKDYSFNKLTPTLTKGESFSLSTKGDRQTVESTAQAKVFYSFSTT